MEKKNLKAGFYWATSENIERDTVTCDYIVKIYGTAPFFKTRTIYIGEGTPVIRNFDELNVIAEIKTIKNEILIVNDGTKNKELRIK
jgi:hypothetical protein